ncbi:MAG TPA: hypothetical protein VEC36_11895 [Patescibacteria group bacterium]|nr:hypothetical protein [Patescibacteria group bacterium]
MLLSAISILPGMEKSRNGRTEPDGQVYTLSKRRLYRGHSYVVQLNVP